MFDSILIYRKNGEYIYFCSANHFTEVLGLFGTQRILYKIHSKTIRAGVLQNYQ